MTCTKIPQCGTRLALFEIGYSNNNQGEGGAAMQKQEQSSDVFVDPVCLMNVSPGSQDIKSTYQTKTYHFCAEGCKKEFESDPEIFLSPKPPKKKGWWGRYLDRLEKATGGKAMKCH